MMNPQDLLTRWSDDQLVYFLKLREIEIPKGLKRAELIRLILENSEVPIIKVNITPYVLNKLTHTQLVDYLTERNYVVLGKAKVSPLVSDEMAVEAQIALLKFALTDFEENLNSADPAKYNHILPKVITNDGTREFHLYETTLEPVNLEKVELSYRQIHLDSVLSKFGISCADVESQAKKLELVNNSTKFLATGNLMAVQ